MSCLCSYEVDLCLCKCFFAACRLLIQRLELMKDELRQRIAKEVLDMAVGVLYADYIMLLY